MTYDETVAQSLTIRGAIQAARETDVAARAEYDDAVAVLVSSVADIYDPASPVGIAADRVRSLRAKLGMG